MQGRGAVESFKAVFDRRATCVPAGVPCVVAEALACGEVAVARGAGVRAQTPPWPGVCAWGLHLGSGARAF